MLNKARVQVTTFHGVDGIMPKVFRCVLASLEEGMSVCPSVGHTRVEKKVPFLTKTTISTSENASYAVYPALFAVTTILVVVRIVALIWRSR